MATLGLVLGGIHMPSAHALEFNTFPGSVCKPHYAHMLEGDGIPEGLAYGQDSVYNTAQPGDANYPRIRLVCPIVRENERRAWRAIYVRTTRSSLDHRISCTAQAYDAYARNSYSVTRWTRGTVRGPVTLYLPPPAADNANGAFEVVCELPGSRSRSRTSAIHSISVLEADS